ncbi:MAG: SsrA-binding protein SmpB [Candidatus Taylorbacteria bacterium]
MQSLIENKRIHLDYEILEKFDAGIELFGFEVKSLKNRLGSLLGAHVTIRGGEAYVINSFIPAYQEKNAPKEYDPRRNRRLLLTRNEIERLAEIEGKKGLTIVPVSVYNKERKIKVSIAVVRGKKKYDKREDLKKKQSERDIRREHKER